LFLRRSTTACVLLLALGLAAATAAAGASRPSHAIDRPEKSRRKTTTFYARKIQKLRAETWHWQRVIGIEPSRVQVRTLAAVSVERMRELEALWRQRLARASQHAHNPPQLSAWLCIHSYEGSWSDSGAPYWGGLQMSYAFQQTYGARLLRQKGTADHWSPLEQIWTAVRAHRERGFTPWPNTARFCGLR
jgi:hypothetical protein